MRATSLGHAGILIETAHGSILCDPWFVPAFFGSWFVVPAQRPARRRPARAHRARRLPLRLAPPRRPPRRAVAARAPAPRHPVLLPGYPTRELERTLRGARLHRAHPHRRRRGARARAGPDASRSTSRRRITDGPGGDSALVVSDGDVPHRRPERLPHHRPRRARAPTARSTCTGCSTAGRSGTRWSTSMPDGDDARARARPRSRASSPGRCATSSRSAPGPSCPSAGPPCFLDPELFHLNVIDGDEPSIFADQRAFLDRLDAAGPPRRAGHPRHDDRGRRPTRSTSRHPIADDEVDAIFDDKARVPARATRPTGCRGSTSCKASWDHADDRPARRRCRRGGSRCWRWPRRCAAAVGAACLLRAGDVERPHRLPRRRGAAVRRRAVRASASRSTATLVETVVAERAVDWSNSLFLSCRFRAWRDGEFNEYVYNFFKSLSVERMRRTEAEARAQARPADRDRARHRARRLGRAAPLPAPQRRPRGVRRDRRLRR